MATQLIHIAPRDEAEQQQLAKLYRMLIHDGTAALVGPDNSKIDLPASVYEVLVKVVETMEQGKTITLIPNAEELSTQAAADMLGVSRPFFVKEIDAGKIQCHYVGSHRRVYLTDLNNYRKGREMARRSAIDRIAQTSQDLGVYDKFILPEEGVDDI